uniref:KASH domain-containing protein n=1 Tax=Angiostrongylus cantonensis TaxID=6313 RepID=A0A0K0CYF0_ANGCA
MRIDISQRRFDVEEEIARSAADEALRNTLSPISRRLVQLVNDANRLLLDAEGVPSQYRPSAEELINECKNAITVLHDAPKNNPSVEDLNAALSSAENIIPCLEERANNWDEFVQHLYSDIEKLRTTDARLNEFVVLLRPLLHVLQEIRFFSVDQESTEKRYEEIAEKLADELTAEAQLKRTLEILATELNQCDEELTSDDEQKDRLSHESLLQDIIAHLENQKVIVDRSAQGRQYIESSTSSRLDLLTQRAQELLEALRNAPESSHMAAGHGEYDIDAAADVLVALYPGEHIRNVLAEHGFEGMASDTDSKSDFESIDGSSSGLLSPVPDTVSGILTASQYRRQRSRWKRVLRTALPLQAMLVLLLGAACLVPHCDDEYCCQLLNNFARSFDPSLEFVNGLPPF